MLYCEEESDAVSVQAGNGWWEDGWELGRGLGYPEGSVCFPPS